MQREMLIGKIHRATITDSNLAYEGSIGIDTQLVALAGLRVWDKVLVAGLQSGARFETYIIAEPAGSRRVVINGAAARLVQPGDQVIIMGFGLFSEEEAERHQPALVRVDSENEPIAAPA